LELYFGVSGTGRVLHTLNPRLHPDQVVWIANHAEDKVLCFDMTFLPIIQAVHSRCPMIQTYVALCDADKLPADSGIPNLVSYEAWIAGKSTAYAWPQFDENSASSMCYTVAQRATLRRHSIRIVPPRCMPTRQLCQM
jgi:fatty-acyl-CoA synthase